MKKKSEDVSVDVRGNAKEKAILRSADGRFFEVPVDDLSKYEIPEKRVMGAALGQQMGLSQPPARGYITINFNFGACQPSRPVEAQPDVEGHMKAQTSVKAGAYEFYMKVEGTKQGK